MTPSPLDPALARFPTTEPGHGAPPLQRTKWRSLLRTGYTPHQAEAILDWLARGEWVEQLAHRPSVAAGCTNAIDMSCAELPVPFIPRAVLMSKKTTTHFDIHFDISKVLLSPKRELTIVFHNTSAISRDFDAWVIGPVAPRQTPAGDKPARPPWTVCHGGIGHGSCHLTVKVGDTARLVRCHAEAKLPGSNYSEKCRLTGPLVPKVISSGMRIGFIVEVPGDFDRNFAVFLSWEPVKESEQP